MFEDPARRIGFKRRATRAIAALLAAGALTTALAAQPAREVTLNFVNADVQSVIKVMSEVTGRTIITDPRVTGTVNLVAARPVPPAVAWDLFLATLRTIGFAAVPDARGTYRVVPEAEAKFLAGPETRSASSQQIVTEVFQLKHERAPQLVPLLRPLVAPNNVVSAAQTSNAVVVTDYAENIERIRRIIDALDRPGQPSVESFELKNASAVDAAQSLFRLVPEASGQTPTVQLTIDPRTNALLVRAPDPQIMERVRGMIGMLDRPSTVPGNIHVVYLRNADATRLADVLRGLVSGQATQRTPTGSLAGGDFGSSVGGQQAGQPNVPGQPTGVNAAQQQGQFGQPRPPGSPSPFGPTTSGTSTTTPGGITIQAYPETNSVLIIAPDSVYTGLRAVIDKLDARRAQVHVEALIVEVTASRAAEFGIQWQDYTGVNQNGSQVVGGTNFSIGTGASIAGAANNLSTSGGLANTPPGLNLGLIKGRISIGGQELVNLQALARALQADSTANILSTPTLVTLENEEARIIVGQNIPIVTGSFTLASGGTTGTNPFQTFERRDIGVSLRVRPQVAEGGTVKMAIYQEVSSISSATSTTGIILNKRALESNVAVDDGQILVLGGLIADDVQTGRQSVPILGDIPFLGQLFRYDTRSRNKTNLLVFMRPIVLRDPAQASSLTNDRYEYIRNVQAQQPIERRIMLPDLPTPSLPTLPLSPNSPLVPPSMVPPAGPPPTTPQAPRSSLEPDPTARPAEPGSQEGESAAAASPSQQGSAPAATEPQPAGAAPAMVPTAFTPPAPIASDPVAPATPVGTLKTIPSIAGPEDVPERDLFTSGELPAAAPEAAPPAAVDPGTAPQRRARKRTSR